MNQSLSFITDQYLDTVSVFKIDTGMPQDSPNNTRRQVLRSTFQPIVLYLCDQGHTQGATAKSPESILKTVIGISALQLDENLVREIREKYKESTPDEQVKDWMAESLEISLTGDIHPIKKLSQAVTGRLSEKAKKELTQMGIVS